MPNYKNFHHFNELPFYIAPEISEFPNFVVTDEELMLALGYPLNDKKSINHHTSSTGKSGLNVTSLLMEPKKPPEFDHFSTAGNPIKKDIIICNPLLKLRALEPGDTAFLFSLLRTKHNVYIWQGSNTPFSQLKSVNSTKVFYDALKDTMQPQKASEVEKALALDGKSLEEVIILDFNRYGEILSKLPVAIAQYSACPKPHSLDLSQVFIKKDEIDFLNQTIETLNHITFGYHALEEYLYISKTFKNIKSLHISDVNHFSEETQSLQIQIDFFRNLQTLESLSFNNTNNANFTENLKQTLSTTTSLKSINVDTIFRQDALNIILLSCAMKLEHISIKFPFPLPIDLKKFFLYNKTAKSLKINNSFLEFDPNDKTKIKALIDDSDHFFTTLESKSWVTEKLLASTKTLKSLTITTDKSFDTIRHLQTESENSLLLDFSSYHSLTELRLVNFWAKYKHSVIKLPDSLKALHLGNQIGNSNIQLEGNLQQLKALTLNNFPKPITYPEGFGCALFHLALTKVKIDSALLNSNLSQLKDLVVDQCTFDNEISFNAGNLQTLILNMNNKAVESKTFTITSTKEPTLQFNHANFVLPGNLKRLRLQSLDWAPTLNFSQLHKLEKLHLFYPKAQSVILPPKILALQFGEMVGASFQVADNKHFQMPELESLIMTKTMTNITWKLAKYILNKDTTSRLRYLAFLGDTDHMLKEDPDPDITLNYESLEFLMDIKGFLINSSVKFDNLHGLKSVCFNDQEATNLHKNIIASFYPRLESLDIDYRNNKIPVRPPSQESVKRFKATSCSELPRFVRQPPPYLYISTPIDAVDRQECQKMADTWGPMTINQTFYAPRKPIHTNETCNHSSDSEYNSQNPNLGDFIGSFSTATTTLGQVSIATSKRDIKVESPLKVMMFDSKGILIPVNKFRHFVCNQFEWNARTDDLYIYQQNNEFFPDHIDIQLVSNIKDTTTNLLSNPSKDHAENSNQFYVVIEGTVCGSERVYLPMLHKMDVIETVYIEKNNKKQIALSQDKHTKVYAARLPDNQGTEVLTLLYSFRRDPKQSKVFDYSTQGQDLFSQQLTELIEEDSKKSLSLDLFNQKFAKLIEEDELQFLMINDVPSKRLLPKLFSQKLAKLIEKHEKLHFLMNPNSNHHSKIDALAKFCSALSHESGKEATPKSITGLINVFDHILCTGKGAACLQRTLIMMSFARHIGVDALPILNMSHSRVEIDGKIYDLGGAPANYDVKDAKQFLKKFFSSHKKDLPEEIQENKKIKLEGGSILEKEEISTSDSSDSEEAALLNIEKKNNALKQSKYYAIFQEKLDVKHFTSALELLQTNLPILLQICQEQDAFTLNNALSNAYEGEHLYVDSANDLKKLSISLHFDTDGQFMKREPGLLAQFIQKQRGLLVLNLSTMSAREKSIYKSCVDDSNPTLDGLKISPGIQIVLLINEGDQASQDVSTRCQLASLTLTSNKPNAQSAIDHEPPSSSKSIIVDCLNSDNDWQKYLFAPIQLDGQRAYWSNSPLLTAVKTNQPLIIVNPPINNRAFDLFLYRAQKYKIAIIYGVPYQLPDVFHISCQTRPFKETPKNVTFKQTLPIQPQYFLNVPNHTEYLTELRVDNDSQHIKTLAGFFSQISEQDIILINDSFPKDIWQKLMLHIRDNYPNKRFQFALLPGCQIEGLNQTAIERFNKSDTIQRTGAVLASNDIDFCAKQFQNENPQAKIIPLSQNTRITDLLYTISQASPDSDTSIIQFQHRTMPMLDFLKNDQPVALLINDLNPNLYVELQPLLCLKPTLYINGSWEKLPGQLTIITTPQSIKNCQVLHSSQKNYEWQDYLNTFPVEERPLYQNIKQFLDIASKIPHVGKNMPENVRINFSRIKKLAEAIQNNKTAKNPLRTVFHLEYDPETEVYAYLSVVAKLLFYSTKNASAIYQEVNQQKLNTLGPNSNLWQQLNCLHPIELKKLLTTYENLTNMLTSASLPQFNENAKTHITQMLSPYFKQSQQAHPSLVPKQIIMTKAYRRLNDVLRSGKQYIHLQGESGVGKTYLVHELAKQLKIKLYEGSEVFDEVLMSSADQKILLLDEINLAKNGSHDHLKLLPPNCIVISTGNPSHYPNRHRQDIIQDYFYTIQVKPFTLEETKTLILKPILEPKKLYDDKVAELLIAICEMIPQINPHHTITLRDQTNLAQRYVYLCESSIDQQATRLFKAAISEFLFGIAEESQREKFINRVKSCISGRYPCSPDCFDKVLYPHQHPLPNCSITIPPERYLYYEVLKQDIECQALKSGILIQGESGIGKSVDFNQVLKALKRSPYAQVTVGTQSYIKLVKKAAQNGKPIILDELDLFDPQESEEIEFMLNTILSNKQINCQSSALLTFIILASQNGSAEHYKGRSTVSKAITNRMHKLIKTDYSRDELIFIATTLKIKTPREFVDAFLLFRKEHTFCNSRSFFKVLPKKSEIQENNQTLKKLKTEINYQ